MELSATTSISKEDVAGLRFPSEDVMSSALEKKERMTKLFLATKLGNLDQGKIRIYFSDESGPKVVETTIWATADKNIILKRGMTIPIHRISDVKFH